MQQLYTISLIRPNFNKVITVINNAQNNTDLCSTFNEHLSLTENSQITFTFDIARYIGDMLNPLTQELTLGSILSININNLNIYEVLITKITPEINVSNVIYHYTCQDIASALWSKRNVGYSYSTQEHGGV